LAGILWLPRKWSEPGRIRLLTGELLELRRILRRLSRKCLLDRWIEIAILPWSSLTRKRGLTGKDLTRLRGERILPGLDWGREWNRLPRKRILRRLSWKRRKRTLRLRRILHGVLRLLAWVLRLLARIHGLLARINRLLRRVRLLDGIGLLDRIRLLLTGLQWILRLTGKGLAGRTCLSGEDGLSG
jgi:hypothetical protein